MPFRRPLYHHLLSYALANKPGLDWGKSAAKDIKYAQETVDAWLDGMTTAISNAQKRKAQREQAQNQQTEIKVSYSLNETTSGRPVAVIDTDILDGVPKKDWVKTVKETLKRLYPNGIKIKNSEILITRRTGNEYTWSKYSQKLRKKARNVYADKLRTAAYADDILKASTDYVNESPDHPRNDNFVDFGRGKVLFQIGSKSYSADVIVGYTNKGEMELYDLVNIAPANFSLKTPLDNKTSDTNIPIPSAKASGGREGVTHTDSMPDSAQNVKKNFSLNDAVEETRDLIAVHNVSEKNLLKTLKLGGFPAVSIAITKAKNGWSPFGNISVVFGKETIDPEASADNHVYGEDAWTPEFPRIMHDAPNIDPYNAAPRGAFLDSDLQRRLNEDVNDKISVSDFLRKYRHDASMMQVFHLNTEGDTVPVVFKETRAAYSDSKKYDTIERIFVDVLGKEKAERAFTAGYINAFKLLTSLEEDRIINAVHQAGYDTLFGSDFDDMLLTQYISALQRHVDLKASDRVIKQATNAQEYENWLKSYHTENIGGYFYARDGRRLPVTADNAVEVMKSQNLTGEDASLEDAYVLLAKEYTSVDDIRQDKDRLSANPIRRDQAVINRFIGLMNQIMANNSVYTSDAEEEYIREIASVVRKSEKGSSMQQLKKLRKDLRTATGLQISAAQVEELANIRDAVWSTETSLFEAKPMRNMPLSEAKLVIVPEGTSQELLDALSTNNIPVETYERGNEEARLDLLNGATAQQYMFSLNDSFRTDQAIRKVLGKAVAVWGSVGVVRLGGGEGEEIVRKRRRFILLPHCCCIFRLKYYNKDEILADYLLHIPAQLCYNSSV